MRRLLLLAFIWGWSFLFIKVAVAGMTPVTVAAGRVALGALVLVIILRTRGQAVPINRAHARHFVVAAVFGNALPFTLLAWGEERITSALTAVLNASTPLFAAMAAAVYLGERLNRRQVSGLFLGLTGVAVAAGVGASDFAESSLSGSLASVLAGACYGVTFVYIRRHLTGIPPLAAAAGQLVIATILLAPFAVVTSLVSGLELTPTRVLAIVLLGVVGTGLAYVLNYQVIASIGATKASLVTYVIPVVAVAVGVTFLDEPFEWTLIAGGLLIVGGIALVHERIRLLRPPVAVGPTAAAAVLLLALAVGGCGSDDGSEACGPARREALDPNYLQHVLPGAPEPEYLSDPPTSGPHQPGRPPSPVVEEPLSRPLQVGVLEAGDVLIQHRDPLTDEEVDALVALDDRVVVAPNPDLPDAVVATAWLFKMECSAVDTAALGNFVAEHAGQGPGSD